MKFWFPTALFFFVGLCLVVLRAMHFDLSFVPGDLGDARLNNYFLEHGYKWLAGQVPDFWNAPFFYPATRVMTFSDNFLGTLSFYAVFRFFGLDRETSFQLWFIAIFTLNYFCCAWVLSKLSINTTGCIAGAYIFTFSLPVIAQIGHCQLMPRFMIPLAFYFMLTYLKKPNVKPLLFACIAIVIQFYCTIYIGMFLVLGLITMTAAFHLVSTRRPTIHALLGEDPRSMAANIVVITVSIAMLLPLILPYYQTSLEYGMRSWEEILSMLPRVRSYFYPADGSLFWKGLQSVGISLPMHHEHRMFAGAIPWMGLLLMPLIYFRCRTAPLVKIGMIFFLAAFLLILLTLLKGDFSLYRLALVLPGMKAVRAVSRIILLMLFLFSVISAIVIHWLMEICRNKSNPISGIVLACVILIMVVLDQYVTADGFVAYPKAEARQRSIRIEAQVKQKNPRTNVFVYMPNKSSDPPFVVHLDAMMAAQNLNMATVNGYSGVYPKNYQDFFDGYEYCDNFVKWKTYASKHYGKDLDDMRNILVTGRYDCSIGDATF